MRATRPIITVVILVALSLVPHERKAHVVEAAFRWNYTTVLNVVFLVLAAAHVLRFLTTGGADMMKRPRREHGVADRHAPFHA
jgi:hypothetical protein